MILVITFIILVLLELLYFKIAEKYNIVDRPNKRSSHHTAVIRGGGIIFTFGMIIWYIIHTHLGEYTNEFLLPLIGLIIMAGISIVDDIKEMKWSTKLLIHIFAMSLIAVSQSYIYAQYALILVPLVIFAFVGICNVVNFMDGINGITGGYSLAILILLLIINESVQPFIASSLLETMIAADLIFCFFNFRPKGKAVCFAGDVGSIGLAFILLLLIGRLIIMSQDITYLLLLSVYGIDGSLTIIHRLMLHENIGIAHRKHAYQIMANELGIGHLTVASIYITLQTTISLVLVFFIPDTPAARWTYAVGVIIVLSIAYILFMKKYYHLHEEYLQKHRG